MLIDKFNRPLDVIEILVGEPGQGSCPSASTADKEPGYSLTPENVVAFMKVMSTLGLKKALVTGQEPLDHPDILELACGLASLQPKIEVSLRTSGKKLGGFIKPLAQAGVARTLVRLPSADPGLYSAITGEPESALEHVVRAMRSASEGGLPVTVEVEKAALGGKKAVSDTVLWAVENGFDARALEGDDEEDGDFLEWTLGAISERIALANAGSAYLWKSEELGKLIELVPAARLKNCGECSRLWLSMEGKVKLCSHHFMEHDLLEFFSGYSTEQELLNFAAMIPLNKPQGAFARNGNPTK